MSHELDLPIVDAEGPFPGGWADDERTGIGRVWKGRTDWLTQHGTSKVRWLLGRPVAAFDVVLEGGSVLERCEVFSPSEREFWRRPNDNGAGYTTGLLTIGEDGVSFVDQPMPKRTEEGTDILMDAILAHPNVVERFRDDGFAGAFNEYLRNQGFKRNGVDMDAWSGSWRYIGGMIATVRDMGESYVDFYLHGPDFGDADTAKIEAFFGEIGWHRMSEVEVAEDHSKALALLAEVEARSEGAIPPEERYGTGVDKSRIARPHSLSGRMHVANSDGKTTAAEHHLFFQLYDAEKDEMSPDEVAELIGGSLSSTAPKA